MNRVILIKYGELTTKKGNRNFFINTLYNNIKDKLKNYNVKISKDRSRMYIEFLDQELEQIKKQIDHIFGIHMYHIAYIVNTNLDDIKNTLLEVMKQETFKTFKIETKRSDKTFPGHSQDINREIAGHVFHHVHRPLKVDVHHPEILITVEIRHDAIYVMNNVIKGAGGYPVGIGGKAMLMLSGGIDSPVAGYLTLKRGVDLECVHFAAPPYTNEFAREKGFDLVDKLRH